MDIKSSWDEVTIAEYYDYLEILNSPNYSEFDKKIRILILFAGVEDDYFNHQKPQEVEHLYKSLEFLFKEPKGELKEYYLIGNTRYKLIKQVADLTSGQFIDLENSTKVPEERLEKLYISCSAVLIPCKKLTKLQRFLNKTGLTDFDEVEKYGETPLKETQSNLLLHMKVSDAFAIGVFFCKLHKAFSLLIKLSLELEMNKQLRQVSTKLKELEKNPKLKMKVKEVQEQILFLRDGIG